MAKWSSSIVKLSERESKLATEMLLYLISNLNNERTDIFKYNLDLIKLIVESWKNYIEVPNTKLFEILSSENKCEIGIHLASIFLVNKLEPWQNNQMETFITLLLKILNSSKRSTYRSCAETIGLMLKHLNGLYAEKVDTHLKSADFNKYVYCLEGMTIFIFNFVFIKFGKSLNSGNIFNNSYLYYINFAKMNCYPFFLVNNILTEILGK